MAIQTPPRPILYCGIFDRKKTEVKPEFSKKLDKVFPRSSRRYKLQFHRSSITENAPILSSGTVVVILRIVKACKLRLVDIQLFQLTLSDFIKP